MHKRITLLALGLICSLTSSNHILAAALGSDSDQHQIPPNSHGNPNGQPQGGFRSQNFRYSVPEGLNDILRENKANADFAEARARAQELANQRANQGFFERITRSDTLADIMTATLSSLGAKLIHKYFFEEGPTKQEARISDINVKLAEITLQQKEDELEAQQLILKQKALALYKQQIMLQKEDAENQEKILANEYDKFASTYAEKEAAGQSLTQAEKKHYALCLKRLGISSPEASDDNDTEEQEADSTTALKESTIAATAA